MIYFAQTLNNKNMNKERRQQIKSVINRLEALQDELSSIQDDEQESLDNLPDSLQDSEKAEKMSEYVSDIEYVNGLVGDAIDELNEIHNR